MELKSAVRLGPDPERERAAVVYRELQGQEFAVDWASLAELLGLTQSEVRRSIEWMRARGVDIRVDNDKRLGLSLVRLGR